MKFILAILLSFIPVLAAAQQAKQECFTRQAAATVCDGRLVQPNDASWSAIPYAPSPAYITKVCISNEHAFPQFYPAGPNGAAYGRWSVGVDRGSIYTTLSGYPAQQPASADGVIDRVIGVGYLDIRPGADGIHCERQDPPIKFTQSEDRLIFNFYCGGMVNTIPVVQVCWKVTD